MPHVSRQFIHTLEDVPKETSTTILVYAENPDGSNSVVGYEPTDASYGFHCDRNISVQFYKDLSAFLQQIAEDDPDKFPYELEFMDDADVAYVGGQKMPPFKFGTNSYCMFVGCRGYNTGAVTNTSVPWTCVYYNVGPNNSNQCYPSLFTGGKGWFISTDTKYPFERYRTTYTLFNRDQNKWVYTLHAYYNTDFLCIAFTTPDAQIPLSLIQQINAKDRFNRDWYFIQRHFGYEFIAGNSIGGQLIVRPADDADGNCDCTAGASIAQSYYHAVGDYDLGTNETGFWFASYYSQITTQYPYILTGVLDFSALLPPIVNPCFLSNAGAGKWPNLEALMKPLRDNRDQVYIANPILFNGLFTMSNQILCASTNITNNNEYIYNNKKYYVFGDYYRVSVPFPILFEIDDVEPEENP